MGPFDAWPTGGGGFEHFYGFIGGETNQYAPALYDGTTPVEPDRTPEEGYHFTEDMTDHAIDWVRQQKALMPDKPFFVYFAPGATHAPHHVPTGVVGQVQGRSSTHGWDALREETLARQKELGVIPADAELTARPDEIPAWDDMPDDLKPVLARQMEVYAGFLEHTDHHVGRLDRRARRARGPRRHAGLRASSATTAPRPRARRNGSFNELIVLNGAAGARDDRVHGRRASTTSARPRPTTTTRSAGRTRWTRPTSGPSRSPRTGAAPATARSCTGRTASRPRARSAPSSTTSSTSPRRCSTRPGCPEPTFVHGVQQMPLHGVSMAYAFDDAAAAERRETQYFEMFVQPRHLPQGLDRGDPPQHAVGDGAECPPLDDDVWELYAPDDWTQAHDLAAEQPEKLRRAAAPVPDRGGEVQRPAARRPPRRALQLRPRRAARS